jgi:hypothetical protein
MVPSELLASIALLKNRDASDWHGLSVRMAALTLPHASPSAHQQLEQAQRFLLGQASAAELAEARQECWAYLCSLPCYCAVNDAASARAVLRCLESEASRYTLGSLTEQASDVLLAGVPAEALAALLREEGR